MLIKRFAEHRSMPWHNGRGESLEIASDRDTDDAWTWRLAMAPVVTDGPFSKIDGVDRQLVLVDGLGMTLTIDRREFECKPLEVVSFRGEAMTSARLTSGTIRDINLMTRRGSCSGSLTVARGGTQVADFAIGAYGGDIDKFLARLVVAVGPTQCVSGTENLVLAFGDAILLGANEGLSAFAGTAVVATIIDEQGPRQFSIRAQKPRSALQSRSQRQSRD